MRHRRLLVESLEPRQLLASDVSIGAVDTPLSYLRTQVVNTVTYSPLADNAQVGAAMIQADLNAGRIVIVDTVNVPGTQDGDIAISASIQKTAGGDATLDLRADDTVLFVAGADVTSTNNRLHVVLNADRDGSGAGCIDIGLASNVVSNGGQITLGGGGLPLTGPAIGVSGAVAGVTVAGSLNSGGGNISVRGQGFGSGATDNAQGIAIVGGGGVASSGGDITFVGVGGNTTGTVNAGVALLDGVVQSTSGSISITGTGGGTGTFEIGILLDEDVGSPALISSQSGTITLDGSGSTTGGGTSNDGIRLQNGANRIESTGSSQINIRAVAGADSVAFRAGYTGTDVLGGGAATGDITIVADSVQLDASAGSIVAGELRKSDRSARNGKHGHRIRWRSRRIESE